MSITETIREALAKHELKTHHAGNGYNEPREAWAECSCGVHLDEWQQFYNETDYDPEGAFAEHQAYAVAAALNEGGAMEWAMRVKETPTRSSILPRATEAEARREHAASIRPDLLSVVSRVVGPWQEAPDD